MPIAAVLGQPREGYSRHTFRGGNFFMLRMLNRYRDELGVARAAARAGRGDRPDASITCSRTPRASSVDAARARATGSTSTSTSLNLAGHKFPTGYPSRRAWLHVAVTDAAGRVIFESGAFQPDGRVAGNDNDADARAIRAALHARSTAPTRCRSTSRSCADTRGSVTTGLLSGVRYAKDNRLLPRGFDKTSATADVAVHGDAVNDADFGAGADRVRYLVDRRPAPPDRSTVTVRALVPADRLPLGGQSARVRRAGAANASCATSTAWRPRRHSSSPKRARSFAERY